MDLKAPVTLDALMKEWSEDTNIKSDNMEMELLRISFLHSKYLNILSHHRVMLRKVESDYKLLKGLREEYYLGHLTQEELEERGWEPCRHVLSNPQIARKLEADPELHKLLLKRIVHDEVVTYCETVLKSISSRTWDLGNYIKYLQLTMGK